MPNLVMAFDNLDDRRESRRMLDALDPADRYRFVNWCASVCEPVHNNRPVLTLDGRSRAWVRAARRGDDKADLCVSNECWAFVWILTAQWGLDVNHAFAILNLLARGKLRHTDLRHGERDCVNPDDQRGRPDRRL